MAAAFCGMAFWGEALSGFAGRAPIAVLNMEEHHEKETYSVNDS